MGKFKKLGKFLVPAAMIALPLMSFAAVNLPTGSALDLTKVQDIIERIANFLIIIAIVIAVIFIVWGGIRYMTSRGDKTKSDEARKMIINGVIGAAVVLGVGVILNTTAGLVTRSFFGVGQ